MDWVRERSKSKVDKSEQKNSAKIILRFDFKAKEPDFKPSCYYTNTKAREINDSKIIAIDYYYLEKLFKWFTEY